MPLIECVPNFSEGRRADVIAAIRDAIASAPVLILDTSSDPDHHRTVITFVGEPDSVADAACAGVRAAVEHISLEAHHGEHPRIGAADVLPFVPLRDADLGLCIALAHRVGQQLADELRLPVYFYEAAALREDRRNLADVRRGGYEALRTSIATDPRRAPDVGPTRLSPAGALAVGARMPLIAFNVYLDSDDLDTARRVAAAVRTRDGGLPALKALGMFVGGRAQVSMNLTDYRQTGLHDALAAVTAAAEQLGVRVAASEIVGLVPQAALLASAADALRLPHAALSQTLEARLGALSGDYRPFLFE